MSPHATDYLHYDAAVQRQKRQGLGHDEDGRRQHMANVGNYIGSASKQLADRQRHAGVHQLFRLFDDTDTGVTTVGTVQAKVRVCIICSPPAVACDDNTRR